MTLVYLNRFAGEGCSACRHAVGTVWPGLTSSFRGKVLLSSPAIGEIARRVIAPEVKGDKPMLKIRDMLI